MCVRWSSGGGADSGVTILRRRGTDRCCHAAAEARAECVEAAGPTALCSSAPRPRRFSAHGQWPLLLPDPPPPPEKDGQNGVCEGPASPLP